MPTAPLVGGRAAWPLVALAVLTVAAYLQVAGHGFLRYDDEEYVTANDRVKAGLSCRGAAWAITSTGTAANWHPLTWMSHMLDVSLFGLDPGRHHLHSLALHVAGAWALWLALAAGTGSFWRSGLAASWFALHPLHVESVAWVAERKDVLSGLLWMLTMLAYVRYARRPAAPGYFLTLLAFALGLMAKPMLVTLPFVLLLLDFWPLGRMGTGSRRVPVPVLVEKIPFLVLALGVSLVTLRAQAAGGAMAGLESHPLTVRLTNALAAYAGYVAKAFWPSGLAVHYPHPGHDLPALKAALSGAFLASVTAAVLTVGRFRPHLAAGWLWFLGTLVPVIGLVQVGGQAMADRYTYLPLTGIFIMLAWSIPWPPPGRRAARAGVAAAAILSVAAAAVLTRVQTDYWRNTETLFSRAVSVTEGNWLMNNDLGAVLAGQGRRAEAERLYREAIRLKPDYESAYNNLGNVLLAQERTEEALSSYVRAMALKPGLPETYNNIGVILLRRGKAALAAGYFEQALERRESYADAHYNLGLALEAMGRRTEALSHLGRAAAIDPADEQTRRARRSLAGGGEGER